ncbi:CxxxxCH/CxxCH domain-containing protein [candidate division KSB1 bacterium]|nr:CxxxxCH/CxxCH domain-containing protein [candidate division KSB1 bacterium]
MKSIILLLTAIPLIFLAACSDPEIAPTAPQARVSVHEPGWTSTLHGNVLAAKQYDASECRQCHGNQLDGGISAVSCKSCHASFPHPATGWVVGANSHIAFLRNNAYNLQSCQGCHGQNYDEVKINNSCSTCHTKPGGPEACNTCHGNSDDDPAVLTNVAPPRGLNGETAATTPAVGAHQAHLAYYPSTALASTCQQCHALPQNFAAAGHIDPDGNAELLFNGDLAKLATEGGARVPNVSYNAANNTCAGTYCHGNWGLLKSPKYDFIYIADKMEGASATPNWTDAASAACETCHKLPPTGHHPFDPPDCATCHIGVIDVNGNIIDDAKHVNGKVNVFLEEYPMF